MRLGHGLTRRGQRDDSLPARATAHRPEYADELGAPIAASRLESGWASALRRAEVPVIRWHDLRHTHATLMLNAGRPVHEVARRLGHKPEMCLSTYAHLLAQQGQAGAVAFAALVDG